MRREGWWCGVCLRAGKDERRRGAEEGVASATCVYMKKSSVYTWKRFCHLPCQ